LFVEALPLDPLESNAANSITPTLEIKGKSGTGGTGRWGTGGWEMRGRGDMGDPEGCRRIARSHAAVQKSGLPRRGMGK